jgi:phage FluMu protein Com
MPTEEAAVKETNVRCPECGYWVMKGKSASNVEVNCSNSRCRTTLRVSINEGVPTTEVIRKK